ncbi:type II toxin-antitoxin system YafQ family toxin [Pseudohongiella nitratireducens]|uniref:type II toxin-antitoxin system YafQ family toxin n=1 Tax=Pseudohongiella nitratireducens TaxID=1768907 RepID=UPI0030EDDDE6|tara:strand:+ start:738 stop:1007 length:270 start_codon:yes stop_codon:yes gene_type:complete
MLKIVQSTRFKRDIKKARKQGKNLDELKAVIELLATSNQLPEKNLDHNLSGIYAHYRECHIRPDWLLIYRIAEDELRLARTGSHSELFT